MDLMKQAPSLNYNWTSTATEILRTSAAINCNWDSVNQNP